MQELIQKLPLDRDNGYNNMDNLNLLRTLTLEELGILEVELLKKRKSKEVVWGLWAGLHFFGAHRF